VNDPALVRPYALTRGRTRSGGADLALEAVVVSTPRGKGAVVDLAHEARAIVELCTQPTTVIDVAATLQVPLGVARVLVADLAGDGHVAVHHHAHEPRRPDVALLERVLDGIRSL
jgi:hypothetical protein